MSLAAFNATRFRKVYALAHGGATQGERDAGLAQARRLAEAAGLSLTEAVAKSLPATKPAATGMAASFNDIFNTPEMRAERAERERLRKDRCRMLVTLYGNEEAVFADTPLEAALRAACKPLMKRKWVPHCEIDTLDGWHGHDSIVTLSAPARAAVEGAVPMPDRPTTAWAEYCAIDTLISDRTTLDTYYELDLWTRARWELVEPLLDTLPARDMADLEARFTWMRHLLDRGFHRDTTKDRAVLATLRGDVGRLLEGRAT